MSSPELTWQVFESLNKSFIMTVGRCWEKAETTRKALHNDGISATISQSIDGQISGLETKWTYEIDRGPGTDYRIGTQPVAVCLGHWMLWYAADLMKSSPVTIFEDDARMVPDWKQKLQAACEFLPDDWDMLFLGSCCTDVDSSEHLGNGLCRMKAILCTHAYIVSAKGLPLLLKYCHKIWAPLDIAISIEALPHMKIYATMPRIAEQNGTILPP